MIPDAVSVCKGGYGFCSRGDAEAQRRRVWAASWQLSALSPDSELYYALTRIVLGEACDGVGLNLSLVLRSRARVLGNYAIKPKARIELGLAVNH
jgi:hypothetical protein